MRTIAIKPLALTLLAIVVAFSVTVAGQKSKTRTPGKTLIGYISDASCGLKHMEGMNDKDCTLMCAKNGSFVLADREKKIVYELDDGGQKKAAEFAGQKVKVTGRLSGKRIRVTSIEAAS